MITKLTKEQELGIAEWQKHCLQIGRDTSPVNKEVVEKSWCEFYKILGKKEPMFWYNQSPFQAQIIINLFQKGSFKDITNIVSNIKSNIDSNTYMVRSKAR